MTEEDINQLIKGCISQDRYCQKSLYKAFYSFAMSICLRYTNSRDDASEVMNQGFYKVFTHLKSYDAAKPFKAWLGRIMVNASIDHYRSNHKLALNDDLDKAEHISNGELTDMKLNYDDLLSMVQKLPDAYRTVFNLYAIEGFSHEEIAEMLHVSTGTTKSNLFKARQKLKAMIFKANAPAQSINKDRGMDYTPIIAIGSIAPNGVSFNNNMSNENGSR